MPPGNQVSHHRHRNGRCQEALTGNPIQVSDGDSPPHCRPRARRACGPGRADPARSGQDGKPSGPWPGSAVLTDLLTTALDNLGHGRTAKSREQG